MRNDPRRLVATACAVAFLLSLPVWHVSPAAQGSSVANVPTAVPARLSDAEFWKLSTEMSEQNGYFPSENFVGNELSFQWVIPNLKKTITPGGVYLGVGPDQNFTYIAALKPKIVFIVDIREGNLLQLLMYKALMELSANRTEFAAKLFGRKTPAGVHADASADAILAAVHNQPADRAVYDATLKSIRAHLIDTHHFPISDVQWSSLERIYATFFAYGPGITYQNGNSGRGGNQYPTYWDMQVTDDAQGKNHAYMASDEQFQTIKRMEEANLIVPVVGNFGGAKAIRAVGTWVREHGGTVTTFYTSNVEQYLFQDNIWREYYKNVATLPLDETSTFIRSAFNMGGFGGGSGGLRSAQLTCGIQELLAAFTAGRINSYYDVIGMSK